MKLLGNTGHKITIDKNSANVPHLEITEVISVYCNNANNDYQQNSRALYAFVPNKLFRSLLEISPKNYIFLKIFNSEFRAIEAWFIDQNSQPLEREDKINLTLIIR